jgi:hypothetical protein
MITQWEEGAVDEIYLGWPTRLLDHELFSLVLPKVTKRRYGDHGRFYYAGLQRDWRESLRHWRTYIDERTGWGHFAEYREEISKFLYWKYAGENVLNVRYQFEIESLPGSPTELFPILESILHAKHFQVQARLSRKATQKLKELCEALPDAQIGDMHNQVCLRELTH